MLDWNGDKKWGKPNAALRILFSCSVKRAELEHCSGFVLTFSLYTRDFCAAQPVAAGTRHVARVYGPARVRSRSKHGLVAAAR